MTRSEALRFLREYDRADARFECRHGHLWCSTGPRGLCSEEAVAALDGPLPPATRDEIVEAVVEPIARAARMYFGYGGRVIGQHTSARGSE